MRPSRLLSIDPGATHVGVALFRSGIGEGGGATPFAAHCVWARETQPAMLDLMVLELLEERLLWRVVIEDFVLTRTMADASRKGGKPHGVGNYSKDANLTIECIGGIRTLARLAQVQVIMNRPGDHGRAKERYGDLLGKLKSWGHGGHAQSAELHGWWAILEKAALTEQAQLF